VNSADLGIGTGGAGAIYVPRLYDPAKPACVHVNQDGVQFNAPAVFDELIAKKEMPVTIGVFVMHGRVKAPNEKALDRFNRSYEYDGLGGSYARFLLDELLPEVEQKKAADGRPLKLSHDACTWGKQTRCPLTYLSSCAAISPVPRLSRGAANAACRNTAPCLGHARISLSIGRGPFSASPWHLKLCRALESACMFADYGSRPPLSG